MRKKVKSFDFLEKNRYFDHSYLNESAELYMVYFSFHDEKYTYIIQVDIPLTMKRKLVYETRIKYTINRVDVEIPHEIKNDITTIEQIVEKRDRVRKLFKEKTS